MHPIQNLQDIDRSQWTRALGATAIAVGVALLAWPAVRSMMQRRGTRQAAAKSEPAIDKTLKDTYPASDPPASRYFDIPVNRQ